MDRWVVDFRVTPLGGYAGELADIARWRHRRPADRLRKRADESMDVRVSVYAATGAAASLIARAELLMVFSSRRYLLEQTNIEKQLRAPAAETGR
jgi:hypothetical protein